MNPPILHDFLGIGWCGAVELVRERLLRATAALEHAGVPYAVVGGNAVAAWVARADESAVRNTPDVDILISRAALPAVQSAASAAAGLSVLLEGPNAKVRDAVHVLFAQEMVRPEYLLPTPDVSDSEPGPGYRLLALDALVRMKLTSNRTIDRVHVRDMLDVGLIDASWLTRLPPELAARLQELLDTPEG